MPSNISGIPDPRQISSEGIPFADICQRLPAEWPVDLQPSIRAALNALQQKVVVLDDDPTGTQTVSEVPVLTEWSREALQAEMRNDLPVFYVLTNSRSLSAADASQLNRTIATNLVSVAHEIGKRFAVISRSDSTLRGHFPEEIDALSQGLGEKPDGILLIPVFLEGGRYTINDVQYVRNGEFVFFAGETEFAKDALFGYTSSNLPKWVEEKTHGRISASEVRSISIEDIRTGGPDRIKSKLQKLHGGTICVVNSASIRDLATFTLGLLQAEMEGKRFLYRSAASFIPVRCGLSPRPLLRAEDFNLEQGGGLIVVGSHVPTTTSQLRAFLHQPHVTSLEIDIGSLLEEQNRKIEIDRIASRTNEFLKAGKDVTLFTSRRLWTGLNSEENLAIAKSISSAIVDIVRLVSSRPRYIVAKGGITASDIVTKALNAKRSLVKGQLMPGVPVWQLGPESRYPGTPYVVFPGNVGDGNALIKVAQLLGTKVRDSSDRGTQLSS